MSDVGSYTYGDAMRSVNNAGPHALLGAGPEHTDYRYDRNGNVTSGGGRSFRWTHFNKPEQLKQGGTTVNFFYGADRARYKKSSTKEGTTYYLGKIYEKHIEPDGRTYHYKHYIQAEDKAVAIYVQHDNYDDRVVPPPPTLRYLHHDHLGSVDTITNELGILIERQSYDAFGKRRPGNWRASDPYAINIDSPAYTKRGYTGHEHIDELDLIHMNGRVYDPTLGRFLSADTVVQFENHSQSYNRYAYVLNNPMKYTDPSGHFIPQIIGWIVNFIIAHGTIGMAFAATTIAKAIVYGAIIGFALGTVMSLAAGAPLGQALLNGLKGAFWGAISGAVAGIIGHAIPGLAENVVLKEIVHGLSQGVLSELQGGSFKDGFVGGVLGWVGGQISGAVPQAGRALASAIVGGTIAELTGGKFANGAVSAAFVYLFNHGIRKASTPEREMPFGIRAEMQLNDLVKVGLDKHGVYYGEGEIGDLSVKVDVDGNAKFTYNGHEVSGKLSVDALELISTKYQKMLGVKFLGFEIKAGGGFTADGLLTWEIKFNKGFGSKYIPFRFRPGFSFKGYVHPVEAISESKMGKTFIKYHTEATPRELRKHGVGMKNLETWRERYMSK